jgi:hypothetical protein
MYDIKFILYNLNYITLLYININYATNILPNHID